MTKTNDCFIIIAENNIKNGALLKEIDKNNKSFEEIKHIDENGVEFWYARELMPVLQYSNWQNFEKIIDKAKISCENSGISVFEHFIDVNKLFVMLVI